MDFRINPARPFTTFAPAQFRRWFPETRATAPGQPFEFGLVLAGAVSAGAYTAGVMDFLFQALDAWHAARAAGAAVPRHRVRLKILTGASAGGMTAAIAAITCRSAFPPVTAVNAAAQGAANPFYDSWVRQVGIADLLDTGDLGPGGPVCSLLNCRPLDRAIAGILSRGGTPSDPVRRGWLDDPFRVVLTLTNLSGVPFGVRFTGESGLCNEAMLHRDHISFAVPVFSEIAADESPPDVIRLGVVVSPDDGGWHSLGVSALATGAFPLALKARRITRRRTDYDYRFAYVDGRGNGVHSRPWPGGADGPYSFLAVDGGAMDNEPFEIARRHLAGSKGRNPRDGLAACRAVVMVDPFTDPAPARGATEAALPAVARRLITAFMQQSRFNPIDRALAEAGDVYSRFLVAPRHGERCGQTALASGGLGGFIGFFDPTLRHHDFLLGRANCQRFLRDWFVLPAGNPLFGGAGTPPEVLRNACFRSRAASRPDHLQIIPLVEGLDRDQPLPDRGDLRLGGFGPFKPALERRVDRLYRQMRDELLGGLPVGAIGRAALRGYLHPGWRAARRQLLRLAESAIEEAAEAIRRG